MRLTNYQIYEFANAYSRLFKDAGDIYIPAKANFFLQRNIKALAEAAQEIDKARMDIAAHYGTLNEETQVFSIGPENMPQASKEISDLFNIEQEIDIKKISIDDLADVQFTFAQMQLIMIFIQED